MLLLCNKLPKTNYVPGKPEQSGDISEGQNSQMKIRYPGNKISIWTTSEKIWLSWESERKRANQSINSPKRDSPSLVTVLMAFQTSGISFPLSIADWSLVWWDLFDVKNKGFLLGYTGQDWWCVKSRPQRGETREDTLIFPWEVWVSPKHTFAQKLFGKPFSSTKAGEPSDESELQSKTQGSGYSVVGKAMTKVSCKVRWHGAFTSWANKNSCLSFQGEDRSHFWQRGPSHLRPLAAPLAFSCLSSPSSLHSPPLLQSGDRHADRWT